ncbi:acetyl-CoA synthetase [Streptomyces sp. MnatMP-M17]|nr:acetyl-CoA synthetase [Streptomyces sp. MnatMP-M17]
MTARTPSGPTEEFPAEEFRTATEEFRAARDFLLAHREDYATAYEGFSWPRPTRFNWALDRFDRIAEDNDRTAPHLVEEDGRRTAM